MNKRRLYSLIFAVGSLAILLFVLSAHSFTYPTAKITVRVVDDQGNALAAQEVVVGFSSNHGRGKKITGMTDSQGKFTADEGTDGVVGISVGKKGYYSSYRDYQFLSIENNKWLPWNPTVQLSLRKIENPVPMYARDTQMSGLTIPASGENVGFDLEEYDWLPPYGNGRTADFIFRLDRKYNDEYDFESTLSITFSNPFDGIQLVKENNYGSYFSLPRFAPEKNYQSRLVKTIKRKPKGKLEDNFDDSNNYIFRVRSEVRNKKLIRGMYGKIRGEIKYDPRSTKTASIIFIYYLNPDYTRNLEFDQKQNLFKNLRSFEAVGL